MKVEQRPSHFSSGKGKHLKLIPAIQRPIPAVISSENLIKSIALLSKLEPSSPDQDNRRYSRRRCTKCADFFYTAECSSFSCKACNEVFCIKHRDLTNHQCEKALPSFERYLLAKNIIKSKLKEIKSRGPS